MSSFQELGSSAQAELNKERGTPLGLCLRVIVNEKPLNFEKSTSSVLSVLLLIYACPYGLPDSHI